MANYFNFFPKTFYTLKDKTNTLDVVTNIISRFAFENNLKENSLVYYSYAIQDSDTPEIIAHKFYGNVERHWIVLLFNNIVDPQFDWPLNSRSFAEYVNQKYNDRIEGTEFLSGFDWAASQNNVHSYYKIIRKTNSLDDNIFETEIQIDEEQYNKLAPFFTDYVLQNGSFVREQITKKTKTFLQYEDELNEKKRLIKLLKPEFIPAVEDEFIRVISR
jgi:hypothetical protein